MSVDSTAVKVAVRVRPLVQKEIDRGCQEVVEVIPDSEQVLLKSLDKAFTFNYVLGTNTQQNELYDRCVAPLLKSLFEGYNVTIFAYGQTGSGKTHSMGTAYSEDENVGVIPRAVHEIFNTVKDQFSFDFTITVSFVELYREVLYDLMSEKSKDQCILEIREDLAKGIHIPNLTEIPVNSPQEILDVLIKGSRGRATASTNMNATSSRSHSIFTVNLAMQHKVEKHQNRTVKLHLVDLAHSERPNKTGASGTTFKEGVDINKGLFVLGKVISALGDEKSQNNFVPYRDSNLTRLLQDSLGGNSVTLMITCISPADYNVEETLSTLRYADRARKIKNKPIVNQDPKTAQINDLKKQIKLLQLQIVGQDVSPESEVCDKCEIHEEKIMYQESIIQQQKKKIEELEEILKSIQVENLDARFDNLHKLKDNNWSELLPEKEEVAKKPKGPAKKAEVKNLESNTRTGIRAARAKQQKGDQEENVFSDGYFEVRTPVKDGKTTPRSSTNKRRSQSERTSSSSSSPLTLMKLSQSIKQNNGVTTSRSFSKATGRKFTGKQKVLFEDTLSTKHFENNNNGDNTDVNDGKISTKGNDKQNIPLRRSPRLLSRAHK